MAIRTIGATAYCNRRSFPFFSFFFFLFSFLLSFVFDLFFFSFFVFFLPPLLLRRYLYAFEAL